MISFCIKSTVCLITFYGFYHFFLRNQKILLFNRFYLITALCLSSIIPLISIPVKSDFVINNTIEKFSDTTGQLVNLETVTGRSSSFLTLQNIVTMLVLLVSLLLIMRFAYNLFRILRKIVISKKITQLNTVIVLIPEKILPYSFFKYIFVNDSDFKEGKIEPALLLHEEVHCKQYHSVDILLIELLNTIFWFNPVMWLLRKEVVLNHEYTADSKVISNIDIGDYQQILFNAILGNNSGNLVSNFKYSVIKNRIVMMYKNKPNNHAILGKIAGIMIFLLIGIGFSFSKDTGLPANRLIIEKTSLFIKPDNNIPELFPVRNSAYSEITRKYGEKYVNEFRKHQTIHYGIDIKADLGTDVLATAGGTVIKAEMNGGFGNTVVIDHGNGYQSTYAHLRKYSVINGDSVTKGQTIGQVGNSGLSTGPHLHFEISLNGKSVDPMVYLK